jgi:hypothetical protein
MLDTRKYKANKLGQGSGVGSGVVSTGERGRIFNLDLLTTVKFLTADVFLINLSQCQKFVY